MSHITQGRLKVRDIDALEAAGQVLGFDLRRDQKSHAWFESFVGDSESGRRVARERGVENLGKCEHALRAKDWVQGDYEIGVAKATDGDGYVLLYDTWGPGRKLEQRGGAGLRRFEQEYAVAVALKRHEKTLAREGFKATREDLPEGRVRLRLRRR